MSNRKALIASFIMAAAVIYGCLWFNGILAEKYPFHTVPGVSPPAVLSTPAEMLQYGAWTQDEYAQALKGKVLKHDSLCINGIDTGIYHAGERARALMRWWSVTRPVLIGQR